MKKQVVVIGLGRFGGSITSTLISLGHEVLAIDRDINKVQEFNNIATQAVQADSTDESALKNLGIRNFDHAVVAIGDDIQSNILTTLILKEIGVKKVIAKAKNENHGKVLEKIGADRVIRPERDMGIRTAHYIISEKVVDFIELSPEYCIAEIIANDALDGKTIDEIDLREKYGLNIIAIKTQDKPMNFSLRADNEINTGDRIVVIGSSKDISHYEEKL